MYNQTYDDYLRNIMGYPNVNSSTQSGATYPDMESSGYIPGMQLEHSINSREESLESLYPEIYKTIYPMVVKTINSLGDEIIDERVLEEATENIYNNIQEDITGLEQNAAPLSSPQMTNSRHNNIKQSKYNHETRRLRPRTPFVNDIIKILLLRELFDRGKYRPRPHMPVRPPRPPMHRYNEYMAHNSQQYVY